MYSLNGIIAQAKQVRAQSVERRDGSITIMVVFLLIAMLIMAAVAIEVARVELAETELRVAADSCARLAMSKLAETQSEELAREYAINNADKFTIAGKEFALAPSDIIFGTASQGADSRFDFEAGASPKNAVQITGVYDRLGEQSLPNLFGTMLGDKNYQLGAISVAASSDLDVVLVLDRSASMAFNMDGIDWRYPSPLSLPDAYLKAPHNVGSRWAAMERALTVFVSEMRSISSRTEVGVSSYSSDTSGYYNGVRTSSVASTRELELSQDFNKINLVANKIGNKKLIGGTNISAGMEAGKEILDASRRVTATKVMIVLTDGFYNDGAYPPDTASEISADNVIVHAITFGSQTDLATMEAVAENGNGNLFMAPDEETLKEVFRKLARNLSVKLVQ